MQLEFNIKQQTLTLTSADLNVVADSVKYLSCKFTFCEDWENIIKTAVFVSAKGNVFNVILEEDICIVPWEVIEHPHFTVSVFGGDRITTNKVVVNVSKSGYQKGETPQEPTPDIYAQIIELIENIEISGGGISEEKVLALIASKIDKTLTKEGEAADAKTVGDKLKEVTPVKGVDYWNDEDKEEITDYIDEQTAILKSDIEGIQDDIKNEAHFRGYLSTNAKIQALEATPNDFAYSAESNTKWVYDAENGWQDTGVIVPDQLTPPSDTTPLINGVASTGTETSYARGDHRHPTDTTRASAEELNTLKRDIATALDGIIAIQNELIGGEGE